jgi:hypothetical protein
MKKVYLFLLLACLGSSNLIAQVALAPTAVFLDKNGLGTLYVTNNSANPQEITVSFQFGYTAENEAGNLYIRYDDSARFSSHGFDNIKAFPRTFILPAKQQQLVRIQVRMPKDKADGTYFNRIKVGSAAQVGDVGDAGNTDGVSTKVNVRFEQVIAVFYKKGTATTGVTVSKATAEIEKNLLLTTLDYKVSGNSPFLGRTKTVLKDANGMAVLEQTNPIVLYFEGNRKVAFSLPEDFKPGRYTLEVTFETKRNDISPSDLITAPDYTFRKTLDL